jgi:hypothetical protein
MSVTSWLLSLHLSDPVMDYETTWMTGKEGRTPDPSWFWFIFQKSIKKVKKAYAAPKEKFLLH